MNSVYRVLRCNSQIHSHTHTHTDNIKHLGKSPINFMQAHCDENYKNLLGDIKDVVEEKLRIIKMLNISPHWATDVMWFQWKCQ